MAVVGWIELCCCPMKGVCMYMCDHCFCVRMYNTVHDNSVCCMKNKVGLDVLHADIYAYKVVRDLRDHDLYLIFQRVLFYVCMGCIDFEMTLPGAMQPYCGACICWYYIS